MKKVSDLRPFYGFRARLQPVGIEAIRSFFSQRASRPDEPQRPDPVTVAACALLLEIAHADDVFRPEEKDRIARHIRDEMHVSEDQLNDVFRLAEEQRRESVDLFHFTQLLRENLSYGLPDLSEAVEQPRAGVTPAASPPLPR